MGFSRSKTDLSTTDASSPLEEGEGDVHVAHECESDEDCPDSTCIEVIEGGFRVCKQLIPEAVRECSNGSDDDCCCSNDCSKGKCYTIREVPAYQNIGPDDYMNRYINSTMCLWDLCETDDDCTNDQICIEAFTVGRPNRTCASALCRTDADCDDYSGGVCAPVEDECGGIGVVLSCVYPDGGCRRNSDCSQDEPPFTAGETYCSMGECVTMI